MLSAACLVCTDVFAQTPAAAAAAAAWCRFNYDASEAGELEASTFICSLFCDSEPVVTHSALLQITGFILSVVLPTPWAWKPE